MRQRFRFFNWLALILIAYPGAAQDSVLQFVFTSDVHYEHLGDRPETRQEIRRWVKPNIYAKIRGLLEWRMGEKDFQQLDKE